MEVISVVRRERERGEPERFASLSRDRDRLGREREGEGEASRERGRSDFSLLREEERRAQERGREEWERCREREGEVISPSHMRKRGREGRAICSTTEEKSIAREREKSGRMGE